MRGARRGAQRATPEHRLSLGLPALRPWRAARPSLAPAPNPDALAASPRFQHAAPSPPRRLSQPRARLLAPSSLRPPVARTFLSADILGRSELSRCGATWRSGPSSGRRLPGLAGRGPCVRPRSVCPSTAAAARSDSARARRTVGPHGRRLRTRRPGRHRRTGGRPARGCIWGRARLGERADSPAPTVARGARVTWGRRGAPGGKAAASTAARAGDAHRARKLAGDPVTPVAPGQGQPFWTAVRDAPAFCARDSRSGSSRLGSQWGSRGRGDVGRGRRGRLRGSHCEVRPPRGCWRRNLPRFPQAGSAEVGVRRRLHGDPPGAPREPGSGRRERPWRGPAAWVCCERRMDDRAEEKGKSTWRSGVDNHSSREDQPPWPRVDGPSPGSWVCPSRSGTRERDALAWGSPGGHRPWASLAVPV